MEYDFKIIRSRRKSVSLSVSPENEITVRCPQKFSESRINAFIANKRGWLENILAKNQIKLSENKSIVGYEEIYVFGKKVPLIICGKNEITETALYVKNIKQIKKLFISRFWEEFKTNAGKISESTGLNAKSFSVRAYKRRWGCCDLKGNVTFNYLLFMLPHRLQNYVIIHELCHTVRFNHTPEFWRLVERFEPDYKKIRTELKGYDYITKLY